MSGSPTSVFRYLLLFIICAFSTPEQCQMPWLDANLSHCFLFLASMCLGRNFATHHRFYPILPPSSEDLLLSGRIASGISKIRNNNILKTSEVGPGYMCAFYIHRNCFHPWFTFTVPFSINQEELSPFKQWKSYHAVLLINFHPIPNNFQPRVKRRRGWMLHYVFGLVTLGY